MQSIQQKILVTGANGQLGRCLQDLQQQYSHANFQFMGREHLPINDFALVDKVVEALQPTIIINAAAYTAVDKAESETDTANLMNGYAVGNLAAAATRVGARFLHVSTDYVFNGLGTTPYKETDATDPVNAYGKSKLLGEQLALQEHPEAVIVRTSWVYCKYGHNFVKTMLRLMAERPQLKVVADQTGAPTYAPDLAEALLTIAFAASRVPGIFHFTNAGCITWFDFAKAIAAFSQSACEVLPITTAEFPTPAKRPTYSLMDCSRLSNAYGITLAPWKESLQKCILSLQ